MKHHKILLFFLFSFGIAFSQDSKIYTNELLEYNHAMDLYRDKDYNAAQHIFHKIKYDYNNDSEIKARIHYYEAFCAVRLGQKDADDLMINFFENFPASTKRNTAFLEVGDYYFVTGKYAYALKWYATIEPSNLSPASREEFTFKKGYSLFAVGSYGKSKKYFSKLLKSPIYGIKAKYYYGYIAYQANNYDEADKYLSDGGSQYDKNIPYYRANIKFKTGKFQEAIDIASPLVANSKGIQKSELSKIIGESYFNLEEYKLAEPFLIEYKGKKGKWNNTDYYQLGYTYYMLKDYENAEIWFSKIIEGKNAVSQNAYYHLAECYILSDKKQEALNAFRNTKEMDFDDKIRKDAWLNYAKLSYEIGNPYGSVAKVIQGFINAYPYSAALDEMKSLLISAYISSRDFKGAIDYMDINKSAYNDEAYQKAAYLYGVQLFEEEKIEEAIKYFDLSLKNSPNGSYKSKALFWKAEANYRLDKFEEANEGFKNFTEQPNTDGLNENTIVNYYLGYTSFKLKNYPTAGEHFERFLQQSPPADNQLYADAYMRLGDCYFASSDYEKSILAYQKVIENGQQDTDYATFQMALCYGLTGDSDKKIKTLIDFIDSDQKSHLKDNAYYELGNSYVRSNDIKKALNAYNQVVVQYRMSSLAPRSILKQGLVYYNNNQNEKALEKYKKVIKDYPAAVEAKEAVANSKQIYVDLGRVDEYETLVNSLDFINISDNELDNTMFASAENFYLKNDYKKSIVGFNKYLDRFSKGANILTANYYLADSYDKTDQADASIKHYNYIIEQSKSTYTEQSLVKVAYDYMKKEDWENALKILSRLELEAETEQNITFAQSNIMKGNYALKNYELAEQYAEKVLEKEKIDDQIKSDANIIIARSAFQTGDMYKAQDAFKIVEQTATGELQAEAVYYDAYFLSDEGSYEASNIVIQKLASDFSKYKYWGGKGLIIMAQNFYQLEDAYQATYILESVTKRFSDYEDVVGEAKIALNKIKAKEAKTNSSVKINNPN